MASCCRMFQSVKTKFLLSHFCLLRLLETWVYTLIPSSQYWQLVRAPNTSLLMCDTCHIKPHLCSSLTDLTSIYMYLRAIPLKNMGGGGYTWNIFNLPSQHISFSNPYNKYRFISRYTYVPLLWCIVLHPLMRYYDSFCTRHNIFSYIWGSPPPTHTHFLMG